MTIEDDLSRIAEQEKVLSFDAFDLTTAWQLGKLLQELATERGLGIAIDVTLHSMPVFYAALPGVTPDNVNWVRRKRNMVLRYFRSSYASGLKLHKDGKTVEDNGLSGADYAPHGGSFPINVKGTGCIGAVTVSGLPQRDDHNLAVEALALMLAKDLDTLRLAPSL
ncbi:heme-degrading domain-containing protein [Rhizobium ruizarguesonis]|uniref:heme-degrading domain-containing protein n=1 Tax=Rhizobium ruizarguesonis TaxID=2081791 RepID=UPI001030EB85|nr:heme-degrading domain-containing protein [Rhizobium ruizarguesonis]TAY75309.1 heme-degrading domain-containing protein [Rhizobium ruizarguesonis]